MRFKFVIPCVLFGISLCMLIWILCSKGLQWGDVPTWVAAIATVFYVFLTAGLWWNSNRELRETRDMFIKLNNPQLSIEDVFIDHAKTDNTQFGIAVTFKNFGQTTANNVALFGRWATDKDHLLSAQLNTIGTHIVAVPKAPIYNFQPFEPKTISQNSQVASVEIPNLHQEFKKGFRPLFVRIEIYYNGIDEEEYVFYYLAQYYPNENGFGVLDAWAGKVKECHQNITKK